MQRTLYLFLCCFALLQAQVPAPQDLQAVSATSREVKLAWKAAAGATGYMVERKALGAQQFEPLSRDPLADPQATDSSIAALTTYVYRIKAVNAAKAASQPSKEITVGPPPVGFSQIVPTPKELKEIDSGAPFAKLTQMVFDSNGDPAAAYYTNVNRNDDQSDSSISFVSWNRARYRWNAPVQVMKVGVVGKPSPFSMARDASTNVYAIVSETTDNHSLPLAISTDGGDTWKVNPVVRFGEDTSATCPSIALAGGVAHLAFAQSNSPLQYATGKETDDPANWTKTPVPNAVEGTPISFSLSMATDSEGKPGLAYILAPNQAYNTTIAFWRPGGNAVAVTDSKGFQNDDPFVQLAFGGTKPRIAVVLGRVEERFAKNLWNYFSASTDNGKTWPEPALIVNDGQMSMARPSVAIGPKGEAAVMLDRTGGSGDDHCGIPKLARSGDLKQWSTCSPNGSAKPRLYMGNSGKVGFAPNGKLYALISNQTQDVRDSGQAPEGLVLWREP